MSTNDVNTAAQELNFTDLHIAIKHEPKRFLAKLDLDTIKAIIARDSMKL